MAKSILIVENSLEYQQLISEIVVAMGHEAIAVDRATTAWETLQQRDIALVLLDIKMPSVHGHHFMRFIRKHSKQLSTIVISGFLTPAVIESLRESQVSTIIVKPFKVRRLTEEIARALEAIPEATPEP